MLKCSPCAGAELIYDFLGLLFCFRWALLQCITGWTFSMAVFVYNGSKSATSEHITEFFFGVRFLSVTAKSVWQLYSVKPREDQTWASVYILLEQTDRGIGCCNTMKPKSMDFFSIKVYLRTYTNLKKKKEKALRLSQNSFAPAFS